MSSLATLTAFGTLAKLGSVPASQLDPEETSRALGAIGVPISAGTLLRVIESVAQTDPDASVMSAISAILHRAGDTQQGQPKDTVMRCAHCSRLNTYKT